MKRPRVRVAGILRKNNKILFIEHQKKEKSYLLLPGGGVDFKETFQESLKREFKEETNLNISVKDMKFISEAIDPSGRRHIINIFFEVEYVSGNLKVGDEEILKGLKYVSLDKIDQETIYPNIKSELKKDWNEIKYLGNRWE
ncbi:MAG: NUDIX domain-containing protein [Fusobacteriota bacterium]